MMDAAENHNRLVPELLKRIVKETDGEAHCFIALESLILGVMLFYRPKTREAAEFLDSMTTAVIERMKP
jgi:hypothetical protein